MNNILKTNNDIQNYVIIKKINKKKNKTKKIFSLSKKYIRGKITVMINDYEKKYSSKNIWKKIKIIITIIRKKG